ncbi:MAG: hypothetical protein SGJ04_01410 [Bacteroidota bacterium]|nr:hypothetical protein [Bacteroidota bacterium]
MEQHKKTTMAGDLTTLRELPAQIKVWIESTIEYQKMKMIELIAINSGKTVSILVSTVCWAIAALFLLTSAALGLGILFKSNFLGFLSITILLFIMGVLMKSLRGNIIEKPLINSIISNLTILDEDEEETNNNII